jgi:hypothetical protein
MDEKRRAARARSAEAQQAAVVRRAAHAREKPAAAPA